MSVTSPLGGECIPLPCPGADLFVVLGISSSFGVKPTRALNINISAMLATMTES